MYLANEQLSFENYSDFIDQYCSSSPPISHKVLPTIELNRTTFNPCLTETQDFGDKQPSHFAELRENASNFKHRNFGYESLISDKTSTTGSMQSKKHNPGSILRDRNITTKDAPMSCAPAESYRHLHMNYRKQVDVSDDLNVSSSLSALYERKKEAAKT